MSLTIGSLFAMLLNAWVTKHKINLGIGDLQTWVQTTVALLAPAGIYFGRFRLGGVNWLGLREDK